MLKKRITAKVNRVIKFGSLEEEQAKELQTLEELFPKKESKDETEEEQSK